VFPLITFVISSQIKIGDKAAVALSQRYGTKYVVGAIIDAICKFLSLKTFAYRVVPW
jgi:hypothetical protein